jgi:hypothetical protein
MLTHDEVAKARRGRKSVFGALSLAGGLMSILCLGRWMALMLFVLPSLSHGESVEKKADLIEMAERVQARVVQERGLQAKKPIRWEVASKEKVRSYLLQTLREQYAPGEMKAEGLAMSAIGLIPASLNYEEFVVDLYEEQVGGYYDPKKDTFFLADWIPMSMQPSILSHELTHALQDQNFNIDKFVDRIRGNSDAMVARSALVEGEATLVMMMDAMGEMGMEPDTQALGLLDGTIGDMMFALSASQYPKFAEAPSALRELLLFPYIKGLTFVSEGRKRGGWKRVEKVYSDLPASTEQVIHPEKYYDQRDNPVDVPLFFLDKVPLGDWKKIYEDVLGEFTIRQMLEPIQSKDEMARAAAGWGGDRLRVFQAGKELAWIHLSVWDSDRDAVEFAGAMSKVIQHKKNGTVHQPLAGETRIVWKDEKGRVVSVERKGNKVLIVSDFDDGQTTKIRNAAWGGV